jgi:hypothetical protein
LLLRHALLPVLILGLSLHYVLISLIIVLRHRFLILREISTQLHEPFVDSEFIITADGQLSAIIVDTVPDMTISGFTTAIERVQMEDINIKAAGTLQDMFIVIVPRRKGASALRSVEAALTVIPTS